MTTKAMNGQTDYARPLICIAVIEFLQIVVMSLLVYPVSVALIAAVLWPAISFFGWRQFFESTAFGKRVAVLTLWAFVLSAVWGIAAVFSNPSAFFKFKQSVLLVSVGLLEPFAWVSFYLFLCLAGQRFAVFLFLAIRDRWRISRGRCVQNC